MTRTGPTHTGPPRSSLPGAVIASSNIAGTTGTRPQGSNTREGVGVGVGGAGTGIGTKETPIALLDDTSDDARGPSASASLSGNGGGGGGGAPLGVGLNGTGASAGLKRKSMDSNANISMGGGGSLGGDVSMMSVTSPSQGSVGTAGGKKKRRVEIHPFHPELERKLEELRIAVAKGASPIPSPRPLHHGFPKSPPSLFLFSHAPLAGPTLTCGRFKQRTGT